MLNNLYNNTCIQLTYKPKKNVLYENNYIL